ncbi:hypothetical protein [Kribbella jiaozuonensis]|uniref:Uncharacterized protein n=1 Tax=Kribbella jiaozuonensis TaxID=2575441 RepID=A0A4U3M3N1_9ACTN|nr:hypothetical protein [Kribbella jiaozuonensis]TKK82822.1 hypothetical protein FDA38_08705 [Kribbella jiaozuonensis]
MRSTLGWRIRFALAAFTFGLAIMFYVLLVRDDWNTFFECSEYCAPLGASYPYAWCLFAIASGITWLILRGGRAVGVVNILMAMNPVERTAYLRRKLTLGVIVASMIVLVALAAQRVLQPDEGDTFPFLALMAAGLALLGGLVGSVMGVTEPLAHRKLVRPLSDLGRAAGRGAVPIAVVSATFILTIYSSEAWSALRATPWYTIALIFTILIGASVVIAERETRAENSNARPRRIAGRVVTPRTNRPTRPTSRRWTIPILLGATSLIGFFVIAVDLLQPEIVLSIQDSTIDADHTEYLATVAKIAALLAALTTLVASESFHEHASANN